MKITYFPHMVNITLISGETKTEPVSVAVPSWAEYIAVDENGIISAFEGEPHRRGTDWDNHLGTTYEVIAEIQDVVRNWEDSCVVIDQLNYTTTELILLVGAAS